MNRIFKFLFLLITIVVIVYFSYYKNSNIEKVLNQPYTSKHKINDLYDSKELNYRTILDKEEQNIYDLYFDKLANFETTFSVDMSKYNYNSNQLLFNKFLKINQAIIMDHPEIIYFGYPSLSTSDNKILNINIIYALNRNEYMSALNKINDQLVKIKNDTLNLSDYEKVKYVYEYLGNKNNYGNRSDPISQSAYAAFDDNLSPVCAGYSRASQLIFGNIGINSILISGKLKSNWFSGDSHEWNVVQIDNKYYNYDVTQSSIAKSITKHISYYGLLNNNTGILSPSNKKSAPAINGKLYDYYSYNDLEFFYKETNLDDLKTIINNSKDKYVELRIKNIDGFKMNFNNIKNELNLNKYIVIDNIIILEKK